jgi:hypothetical protein
MDFTFFLFNVGLPSTSRSHSGPFPSGFNHNCEHREVLNVYRICEIVCSDLELMFSDELKMWQGV